jgi:hypothetical protein
VSNLLNTLRALAPEHVAVTTAKEWAKTVHPLTGRARPPVQPSEELSRVLATPRRPPVDLDGARGDALAELMTRRLRRTRLDTCACKRAGRPCINRLKPAQAWALFEAPLAGGLVGAIGVGHGKTGLDLLAPMVFKECKLAVLLIPPGLREQLLRDYEVWSEHFALPSLRLGNVGKIVPGRPVLHVIPYSQFSRAGATDLLENLKPDLIIADEAQKLRHRETATTARVLRYLARNPETRLCVWSGTLTAKSIKDYAHLSAFALKESSPLPLDPQVVEEWALALDPSDWQAPSGALGRLCEPGEHIYQGYYRRFSHTLGVVATKAGAVDASIYITERKAPTMPAHLREQLDNLRAGWVRPDGEELVDMLQVARSARELASGFFYRWKFPRGEADALILQWLAARKAWHRELREKLRFRREHLDSPLLCSKAAIRATQVPPYEGDLPVWKAECWAPWVAARDTVQPESEAVWIDDYLARDAAEWATKNRGIVWYEHEAFGRRVAELSGLPMHAGGAGAEERILAEDGTRSIIASIHAHGTGRDGLQRVFAAQLVANPPTSGAVWEQLLGRLHRIGQEADEVQSYVYRHTPEIADGIDRAIVQARYIEGTLGTYQKLLAAAYDFDVDVERQKKAL